MRSQDILRNWINWEQGITVLGNSLGSHLRKRMIVRQSLASLFLWFNGHRVFLCGTDELSNASLITKTILCMNTDVKGNERKISFTIIVSGSARLLCLASRRVASRLHSWLSNSTLLGVRAHVPWRITSTPLMPAGINVLSHFRGPDMFLNWIILLNDHVYYLQCCQDCAY